MLSPEKETAIAWVNANEKRLSDWHRTLWELAEPAWREYRSAAFLVDLLEREGFEVERGSGEMPTAFVARYGRGGPVVATYAEYDAVPGNSQKPVPYPAPRDGLHPYAAGHTDPHSALGVGAIGGALAAKAAIEAHGLPGRVVVFGEPAEKVCGSKPVHAAKGYYDGLDAVISFHPAYMPALANTVVWDTHCGSYWSRVYSFECEAPERWGKAEGGAAANPHAVARAPGALDALCLMYTTTKYTKEAMLPHAGSWTLNEAVLAAREATADNLPPRFAQIQYAWRSPTLEGQERILAVLERNAEAAASATHCRVRADWVTKTRVGLPNHAIAELVYRNLELTGPPSFGGPARRFGREIQKHLGLAPMSDPFEPAMSRLVSPREAEAELRQALPPWQRNFTSDDYVDYTWHAPTARLYVGRAALAPPEPGYRYPDWAWNALGGYPPAIDPTIFAAARCIAASLVDLLTDADALARAEDEFRARTGGGIGGRNWVAPLLPKDFRPPIHFPWPEYVTTPRGTEWWLPTPPGD